VKEEKQVEEVVNKPVNEVTFAPIAEFATLSVKETQAV
jgi:hypothetical protein